MWSKNKPRATALERRHIARVKAMRCIVCSRIGPSDAHEIVQGAWFTALSLCRDCHEGALNGIHGRRAIWSVKKLDELGALNLMVKALLYDPPSS